jgi:hypothetical protein
MVGEASVNTTLRPARRYRESCGGRGPSRVWWICRVYGLDRVDRDIFFWRG